MSFGPWSQRSHRTRRQTLMASLQAPMKSPGCGLFCRMSRRELRSGTITALMGPSGSVSADCITCNFGHCKETSSILTHQVLINRNLVVGLQGKTTLLNVLMKRISDLGTAHVQGSILLNGSSIPSWVPRSYRLCSSGKTVPQMPLCLLCTHRLCLLQPSLTRWLFCAPHRSLRLFSLA